MPITIPATSLRSKYLKSLPVNTVYLDNNGHKYQVQEKRINQTLTKVGVNYFGDEQPIELPDDLDPKHLKQQNTNRISIMTIMKERLTQMENLNKELLKKLDVKSKMKQIQEMAGNGYIENEKYIFKVQHGIVFAVRKKGDNNIDLLDLYIKKTWMNPEELHHLITNQPKLQDVILQLLLTLKQVSEEGSATTN